MVEKLNGSVDNGGAFSTLMTDPSKASDLPKLFHIKSVKLIQ